MLCGLGVTLFYVFQHKGIMFVSDWRYLTGLGERWFFGIEPNAFGCVGALVNFGVAYLVSRVTQVPPDPIQRLVEEIRLP
jgi:cation/acetate symporter